MAEPKFVKNASIPEGRRVGRQRTYVRCRQLPRAPAARPPALARRAHFFLVKKMAFWGAFWGIFGAFGAKFGNLAPPNLQILRVSVRSDGSVRTYGAVRFSAAGARGGA